jgi:SAM-dependent methyltransferase
LNPDLFDLSDQYEEMLERGIRISGEGQDYFIVGRISDLRRHLPPNWAPRRILDFGCGTGRATKYLADAFPSAQVVGVDASGKMIARAEASYGSPRIRFRPVRDLNETESFDLCYTNGVLHHIEPPKRHEAISLIHNALTRGGILALFENNPWNPGTRLVMKRIPFDKGARALSPLETRQLLRSAAFSFYAPTRFLFYFPRVLSWLRFSERWLARVPLGAQYCVLAVKH